MFGTRSRGLLLLAVLLCPTLTAAKAATGGLPSLHRDAVDESRYPWSSIGKLYNESGSSCSGVVISSDKILTAAHCLFNHRTGRFVTADALHFLVGYRTGRYSVHVRVARYETGPGFNPLRYDATSDADWAVLTATEPLPASIVPLRLRHDLAPSGTKAVLVGYPQDRAFAMTADRDCELRSKIDDGRLFLHTCRGVNGYSGAPLLVSAGDREVQIAGIQIATMRGNGAERMLAVPAQTIWSRADGERRIPDSTEPVREQIASVCNIADGDAVIQLADIQNRLGFEPAKPDESDADTAELVAAVPADVHRFPTSAIAWFAMEPFALPMP
jgi:protease YdgD